jgi:hypothetical protein
VDVLELKEDSKEGAAILELGRALAELYARAADLSADSPAEGRRAVAHARFQFAVMNLVSEEALTSLSSLEKAVGNADTLVDLECHLVLECLLDIWEKLNSVEIDHDYGPEVEQIQDELSHLVALQESMVEDFSRELDKVGDALIDQVVATDRRVAGLEQAARSTRFATQRSRGFHPEEALSTIGSGSQILDPSGNSVVGVGELFVSCQVLSQQLLVAENQV